MLRSYHRTTFIVKVFASFLFSIFQLYIQPGDTVALFFPEGHHLYQLILQDPAHLDLLFNPGASFDHGLVSAQGNAGYFADESNFMVIRIVAIFCFFTFGKFMAINLFFAMFAFTGIWRLFRFFYEQYPQLHKQFAISLLYLPTFVFWSSGMMKDPISIGALGWFTYAAFHLFYQKDHFARHILTLLIVGYLLTVIKIYIIVSYLPMFALYLILKNVTLIQNKAVKVVIILCFVVGSIFSFVTVASSLQGALGGFAAEGLTESVSSYQSSYQKQGGRSEGSYFSLGVEFDGSVGSLAKLAPAAIVATLFRPYIWESKKISTLLTSFESLAIMLFTLFVFVRVGPKKFLLTILQKPIVLYCFCFSLVFALFVGATTLNFGTLIRYKIPAIPFYLVSMFFILYFNKKLKKVGLQSEKTITESPLPPISPA
ncbi:MAG: hypothetical protein JWQ27_2538 [Ferruginibacter sp.]|nr:hypothetical protein [Ferruginibacter sp.]